MRLLRNHGITTDARQREEQGSWFYEMVDLGYNYRISDFQCALGISQLQKLPKFLERRREIAARYDEAFSELSGINPLGLRADVLPAAQSARRMAQSEDRPSPPSSDLLLSAFCSLHSYHLYVVKIDFKILGIDRTTLFTDLREKEIAINVHYIPVHLHPFYREKFHTGLGLCPVAEAAYEQIISLPIFPGMTDEDVEKVVVKVKNSVCS